MVKCPCGPYKCIAPHVNANAGQVCFCCRLPVCLFYFLFLFFVFLLFLFALWPLGESKEGLRSERSRGGYCELKVVDCSEAVGEGVVPQSRSEREKEVLAAVETLKHPLKS